MNRQEVVFEYLKEHPGASVPEMKAALRFSTCKKVRNAIDALRRKGVKIANMGHGSKRFRLVIALDGESP